MPRLSGLFADLTPLRASPDFRRLFLGNTLSAVGTQLTLVAVSLEVFDLTGSSLYVGLLGLVAVVPWWSPDCTAAPSPTTMTAVGWLWGPRPCCG